MPHDGHAPPPDAVFRLDGNMAYPSAHASGPWDPKAQHGGSPTALLAAIIDALPTASPMQVSRLTIDLIRPAPLTQLEMRADVTREGRNIQACAASLLSEGKEVARASALKIRTADLPIPPDVKLPTHNWKRPDDCPKLDFGAGGFAGSMEVRLASETMRTQASSAVWFRLKRPLIEGRDTSPLLRAALTADFCNGISGRLDFTQWTYINADLTIHLSRLPAGEWVLLEAQSWIGADGRGVAFGLLADEDGYIGRSTQSLVIAQR